MRGRFSGSHRLSRSDLGQTVFDGYNQASETRIEGLTECPDCVVLFSQTEIRGRTLPRDGQIQLDHSSRLIDCAGSLCSSGQLNRSHRNSKSLIVKAEQPPADETYKKSALVIQTVCCAVVFTTASTELPMPNNRSAIHPKDASRQKAPHRSLGRGTHAYCS